MSLNDSAKYALKGVNMHDQTKTSMGVETSKSELNANNVKDVIGSYLTATSNLHAGVEGKPVDSIENEYFYNLMQTYRHTALEKQVNVVEAYEAVIAHVDAKLKHEQNESAVLIEKLYAALEEFVLVYRGREFFNIEQRQAFEHSSALLSTRIKT